MDLTSVESDRAQATANELVIHLKKMIVPLILTLVFAVHVLHSFYILFSTVNKAVRLARSPSPFHIAVVNTRYFSTIAC